MRLIDADALTEELKEWLKDKELHRGLGTAEEIWCNDAEIDVLETIIEDISRMPTVEATAIVKCKDCKFYSNSIDDDRLRDGFCSRKEVSYWCRRKPDDYCNRGELK